MPSEPVLDVLLVAGPPCSSALWRGVLARWGGRLRARTLDLFDPVPEDPSVDGLARRVADELGRGPRPVALVGFGSAVPVALRAAVLARPERLVLSDGPVHRLDPVLAGLARLCRAERLAAETLLRPGLLQRWLWSSAGLRRAVVNPYVMDRDTVVALSAPLLDTRERRIALARYLASLPAAVASPPVHEGPTLLCWGEADVLYPLEFADEARRWLPRVQLASIPGAQHLHPEERPWEMADLLEAWLTGRGTAT